jgi:PAS domain S-box-containing protein
VEATQSGTGLHVVQKPEWTDVRIGSGFRITVRVIGDAIVHSEQRGSIALPELEPCLELIEGVVREAIGTHRAHVHIADYTGLKGASSDARRQFLEYMGRARNLVGVIFYGASPTLKMSIKLGRRLHLIKPNLEIVESFEAAMERAREMLDRPERVDSAAAVPTDGRESAPIETAERTVSHPSWEYQHRGFGLSWEVIDGHVMHGVASGTLRSEHIAEIFEVIDQVVAHTRRHAPRPAIVVDITELEGISVAGRRRFVDTLREWRSKRSWSMLAFFGANPRLKGALAIARPFLPFPLTVTRDLESALQLAPPSQRPEPPRPAHDEAGEEPARRAISATERHIDDVLRFLGNINWEKDGVEWWEDEVSRDHPLAPLFDAITLLKTDVDHLLHERRKAEQALRESTERYRTILENIADGYYEIDLDGRLTFCNDAMLDILGLQRDEIPKLRPSQLMDPDRTDRILSAFKRVYTTGRPATALDWELVRLDRRRISVEVSISLIRGERGETVGFRGIVRDVTERAAAERERARLEAQLRHAQRMEAVGTLAGGIAHNFNNLLMGIQGNVSLVRKDIDPRHPHHHRLETIEALVKGGSRLTNELLGFARAGRYEVKAIDLNELVRQTAATFGTTRREVRVHLELADETLRVRADRGQLEQVLLNLFINAAEAMPTGGDLFIDTGFTTHLALQDRPYVPRPGSYVELTVRDTGVGMDLETQRRIFEPFFTTKGLSGGTGLGLASVYGTVKAHGGYVDVTSTPGIGSAFTVYLPATNEEVFSSEDTQGEIVLGRGTVLVVDDDEAVLEACASILAYLEYTPLRAETGRQAIEVFRERRHEIDLVILDMILPDLNGGEVFDEIKAADPDAKVLLASGYSLGGAAQAILERGCNDFIQKPFTIEQLSQKIGAVLGDAPAGSSRPD